MCLGMPGRILELHDAATHRAVVDVDGVRTEVSVAMIEPDGVRVGEWVVVHLGFALSRIDEDDAQHLIDSLHDLTALYERELSDEAPLPDVDVVGRSR